MHRSPTARLFVAADPPADVREQLAAWGRAATREMSRRSGSPPRVLAAELLHVTLCFLGDRPTEEIEQIAGQLVACAEPVGELSVGAPLWLPPRHPRALAVELHDEDGRLTRLQKALAIAIGEHRDSPRAEARPATLARRQHRFRPHVTVARMRPDSVPRERTLPPTPALSFVPSELVLYRSWLAPEGASYEALATCPIG